MPLIKKKISELPLADSLKGLYTIGYKIIDGIKTSVKVNLEDIQTAYQDVVNAIKKSEEATSNANNAAVTANEKASLANTAAQNAEEIANNPTYIGKDHYVYVYNKDTGSFDKTDIYCKGEPGSSFHVSGEYATLEALKSAVPDGSAVDGFMAVGTEAPYDYYAWVNGEWVSQGKIAGGNVIVLPREILDLTGSSSSEEIFATFGGIDKYKDLLEKLSANNYLVQIGEPSLGSLRHIYTLVEYSVKFASNKQSGALSLNIYNEDQQLRRLHFYLEDNGTTARCGEASTFQLVKDSDVLTKTNTSSFTPTGDYQPATKKYVDDKRIMLTITDEAHIQLISNQEVKAGEAESKINLVFGSIDNFKNIIQRLLSDNILFLKITEKEIFKVSTSHTYCNPDNGAYELSFIYTYTSIADANNISLVTKRIFIALNSNATNFFVVKDILVSDNLTTITKKTSDEYNNIASKDNETMYAITDA